MWREKLIKYLLKSLRQIQCAKEPRCYLKIRAFLA